MWISTFPRLAKRHQDFKRYTDFKEGILLGKGGQGAVYKVYMGDQVYAIKKIRISRG